ncbi:unnamed protein product, partial [Closterium sp. NIES-54]
MFRSHPLQLVAFLLSCLLLTVCLTPAAASVKATALLLSILWDPPLALISTGSNREEWLCTQAACKKAYGKCFMTAADHVDYVAYEPISDHGFAIQVALKVDDTARMVPG